MITVDIKNSDGLNLHIAVQKGSNQSFAIHKEWQDPSGRAYLARTDVNLTQEENNMTEEQLLARFCKIEVLK